MNLNSCRRHTIPIHYYLLPLHCGKRSLVVNRLARSACNGVVGTETGS